MITEDERFIEIQAILAFSDVLPENCTKINDLIIELSKENEGLKNQQQEFIIYLLNMLDDDNDIFSVVRVKDVLQKYKEIIGE